MTQLWPWLPSTHWARYSLTVAGPPLALLVLGDSGFVATSSDLVLRSESMF